MTFAWNLPRVPREFLMACRRWHVKPTRHLLVASVRQQLVWHFKAEPGPRAPSKPSQARWALGASPLFPSFRFHRRYLASTSRFGVGQQARSNRTPLGLHRVAEKVGAGQPIGTVFKGRRAVGYTWQGQSEAPIAHRILWLEGLEPGLNRGGDVDSHARFIYIHGLGDEPSLGHPASRGCVHLAAKDLIPLFDQVPSGTLVWITAR
jgi:hypothetical protein